MSEWTIHGGRLAAAQAAFGNACAPWLDLSTGINPDAWDAAKAGAIDWRVLPDEDARAALEADAAAYFGARHHAIRAVPGSELGLRMLAGLSLPAPFRHVAPGYGTHADALGGGGAAISVAALDDEVGKGGTILLANPNNPDGRMLSTPHLAHLAARIGVTGGVLVIDEAFADATSDASIVPHLGADARVIVLRSFGKFFGLAGLRLGFMIVPADMAAGLDARLGSWPVSAAALAIGGAAYRDGDWVEAMRRDLPVRAAALDAVLRRGGLEPVGACPLFRLVRTPHAASLFDRLARHGILTRPFDHAPDWLRIGLTDDAGLARLDRALAGD